MMRGPQTVQRPPGTCANGHRVGPSARFCPKCGIALVSGAPGAVVRSRDTALAIALVLSFASWLYTWRDDALKFWVALGATAATTLAWVLVAQGTKDFTKIS
ncbi:MAG TPA: hypothetical protein VMD59_06130 [Acidimicrobiales bacterium]|nr:hypothetical protein [Acidimicrobiales bacterium]